MFPFINPAPFLIIISTLTGVLLHDTALDKLSHAIISLPSMYVSYEGTTPLATISSDPHIHVERINSDAPTTQVRLGEDKKYRLQRAVRGHHPFDDYTLPVV